MKFNVIPVPQSEYRVSKYIHSVFFEYFGTVIYDGIWVGKESAIPNINGLRREVVEGCREAGIAAMRWPGGCCADHYHWKDGIGKERKPRIHPFGEKLNPLWRNEFGTDEFLELCALTGAEPVITVNTATGSPEEFLDWLEYVNGSSETKYGSLRAANGHPEPYGVKFWGIGNTDENVWHIDFNNPVAYAQTYLKYQTTAWRWRKDLRFIGLGLSTRHQMPGWAGKALDHITKNQNGRAPDALSVHHYLGGAKRGGELCGTALEFDDNGYYALLSLLSRYQYDIDLHRMIIREHAGADARTKISFDEWGVWHPDAVIDNGQREVQTMRDAIFAALALHIFYRNSDIVEFAMETQLCNLLQSLFETDGEKCFKTPTYYVMKLFKAHLGETLIRLLPDDWDEYIDALSTIADDEKHITLSIVNKHLHEGREISLGFKTAGWSVAHAEIITTDDIHDCNTFEHPDRVAIRDFAQLENLKFKIPPHSIVCISMVASAE